MVQTQSKRAFLAPNKASSVFLFSSGHPSMGTSTALRLSKSLSAGGTHRKVQDQVAQLGSASSIGNGEQLQGAGVSREGRRCLLQPPRLWEVGLGHLMPFRALEGGCGACVPSGCPAGMCPRRRGGLTHRLEVRDVAGKLFLREPLPGETKQAAGRDLGLACPCHSPSAPPSSCGLEVTPRGRAQHDN